MRFSGGAESEIFGNLPRRCLHFTEVDAMRKSEPTAEIKSPDEILRSYIKSMRESLRLAVFEVPPDFFTDTMAKRENAVLIYEGEAGKDPYFVYGRFKSLELQAQENLSQESNGNRIDAIDFAEEMNLATFVLQSDDDDEDADELYDLFALCGWRSKVEGFENAARKFERLGTRRRSGNELKRELSNPGLSWILGYELTQEEAQRVIETTQN